MFRYSIVWNHEGFLCRIQYSPKENRGKQHGRRKEEKESLRSIPLVFHFRPRFPPLRLPNLPALSFRINRLSMENLWLMKVNEARQIASDRQIIAIDCTKVENAFADNLYERSELNYLIYNDPIGYADLILNGDAERYLKSVTAYKTDEALS